MRGVLRNEFSISPWLLVYLHRILVSASMIGRYAFSPPKQYMTLIKELFLHQGLLSRFAQIDPSFDEIFLVEESPYEPDTV